MCLKSFLLNFVPRYLFHAFFRTWQNQSHIKLRNFAVYLVLSSVSNKPNFTFLLSPTSQSILCITSVSIDTTQGLLNLFWTIVIEFAISLPCLFQIHLLQNCQVKLNGIKNLNIHSSQSQIYRKARSELMGKLFESKILRFSRNNQIRNSRGGALNLCFTSSPCDSNVLSTWSTITLQHKI